MISYYAPSKVSFSAFGDWGLRTPSRDRVLATLAKKRLELDFCVLLGDNFYPDGVSDVDDPKWKEDVVISFPASLRLYAILGNHDYHSNGHAQVRYTFHPENRIWKMPHYYYSETFEIGDQTLQEAKPTRGAPALQFQGNRGAPALQFQGNRGAPALQMLFIDTPVLDPGSTETLLKMGNVDLFSREAFREHARRYRVKQLQWLEEQLSTSRARWKIVCGHYPLISNGAHTPSSQFYDSVFPLLERHGVQVYMAGHDHNAQVIVHRSVCCCVAGAVSMSSAPTRRVPGTIFLSTHPGQMVCEVTPAEIKLSYVDENGNTPFQHTMTHPV